MFDTKKIRQKILELAIRGQLVPQCPEDGTAEDLYAQIQAEKQKLIKTGKLKKEKPLPEITDEEKPFDIPKGWKWVRLRSIVFNRGQKVPDTTFSYVDIGSIDNQRQRLSDVDNLVDAENAPSRARKIIKYGDILYSTVRPYLHNMCIVDRTFRCEPIASTGFAVMTCYSGVVNKYLFNYLRSTFFDAYANLVENSRGVSYPAINDDRLYRAVVPLPPLAEQKRIVAKVEELLREVDAIEKAQEAMKKNTEQMKRKLLELAIQGKLVEQDPNDEPASVLLERIREEKKKLIAEGKIKKDKNESVIFMRDNSPYEKLNGVERSIADEVPFELPNGWAWARLGTVFQHNTGKALNGTNRDGEMLSYITTSNLYWNRFVLENLKTMAFKKNEIEKCTVTKGDLLVIEGGFYFGRAAIWNFDFDMRIQNHIHRLRPYKELCIDFFYYIFFLYKQMGLIDYKGIGMQGLSSTTLHSLLLPLPPLAEQKRIVAKLEQLFSIVKDL